MIITASVVLLAFLENPAGENIVRLDGHHVPFAKRLAFGEQTIGLP